MTCEARLLTQEELNEAMEPLSADAEALVAGHIDVLTVEAAKVPGLQAEVDKARDALGRYCGRAGAGRDSLADLIEGAVRRGNTSEDERDEAQRDLVGAINERDAARTELSSERVKHAAFQDAVEASAARLETKVASIEAQLQEAFAQRDAARQEHTTWKNHATNLSDEVLELRGRVATLVKDNAAVGANMDGWRSRATVAEARVEILTAAMKDEVEWLRGQGRGDGEGPHPRLAHLKGILHGAALPTPTPPAPAQGVAKVVVSDDEVEEMRQCVQDNGAGGQVTTDSLLRLMDSHDALARILATMAPTPPALVEAVGPLAEKIREVESGPRSIVPPWQDFDWNLRLGAPAWVAIREAYDAAKGGETWAPKMQDDLRVVLALATTGEIGTTQTPLGQRTVNAVQDLRADAARFRAAVELARNAAWLSLAWTHRMSKSDCARLLLGLDGPVSAPQATLDKVRGVEVLLDLRAMHLAALKRAQANQHERLIYDHRAMLDALQQVATRLGITLDAPPSGPGGGEPARQDVLDAFAVEADPAAELERYQREHPALAQDLAELAHELAQPVVEQDGPLTAEDNALVDAAWERHKAAAPLTRAAVERVVKDYRNELISDGRVGASDCRLMIMAADEVLLRLLNRPAAPESSTPILLAKNPVDSTPVGASPQRARRATPTPDVAGLRPEPIVDEAALAKAMSEPSAPNQSRFALVEPDEDTANGKTTGFDDRHTAPEVVWQVPAVRLVRLPADVVRAEVLSIDNGWVASTSTPAQIIARALAEALRKLKRADLWCGCGCGARVRWADDPRAYHCRVAERHRAATRMRERVLHAFGDLGFDLSPRQTAILNAIVPDDGAAPATPESELRAYPSLVDAVRRALGHLRDGHTDRVGDAIAELSQALGGEPRG